MKDIVITSEGADMVEKIMPVMQSAFDPQFGEAWNAAQCYGMLTLPGTDLLVARSNSEIVGFSLLRTVFEESELLLIATHKDQQRKGVGLSLIRATIAQAEKKGSRTVFLEVREGNPALELYFNVGFIQVGTRESYYRTSAGEYFNARTLRYEMAP